MKKLKRIPSKDMQRFFERLNINAAVERNIPASAKDIQEQVEHMNGGTGKVVAHEFKNRKERRYKEPEAKLLNNRGNAGEIVWRRMALFGMKLTNYKLGISKTGESTGGKSKRA